MRILFLSLTFPLPANNGYRMRIWAILRALAAEGHDTSLLTFASPGEAADTKPLLAACRNVEVVPLTLVRLAGQTNYLDRLRGVASLLPYGVTRFASVTMQKRIMNLLETERFDAVVAEAPHALINLPLDLPVPLILDDQNLEHMILRRYFDTERNLAKKYYAWWEWWKLRNWERKACSRAKLTFVCSEHDRSGMSAMCPQAKIMVVPNIIDFDAYAPAIDSKLSTVVYVGGLDWLPNRDAVEFFVTSIFPELRKLAPEIVFVSAYSADHAPPQEFLDRFASIPHVQFLETPDVRKVMAEAGVFVVPIRIGSGTRFKILEAAAMTKPIVSTHIGAEGLGFEDEKEIRLVDAPVAFARAVADLLADSRARNAMGQAARQRVAEHYSFPVLRKTLGRALRELSQEG
ncbi:MAG TPA: glycosyltransferase family 4 protein [Candidatus Cybelea sp.]|nr:glycosyltransferase family 4 protein [Candidatus Cybelea sp.]